MSEPWPLTESPPEPQCLVLNEDTRNVVAEFGDYGTALAWITDTHDHQENVGLPLSTYSIYPVKASLGGRDLR